LVADRAVHTVVFQASLAVEALPMALKAADRAAVEQAEHNKVKASSAIVEGAGKPVDYILDYMLPGEP